MFFSSFKNQQQFPVFYYTNVDIKQTVIYIQFLKLFINLSYKNSKHL